MLSWTTDKLENFPIEFIDGDRSSKYPKREEFVCEGIPFINADSISEGYLNLSKSNFVTHEKFSTIKKGRLKKGDIILTTRGNGVGKTAYFSGICKTGLINAQLLIIRANINNIDSQFLYYLFTSPQFQAILKNYVSGSAQPQIPIRDLKKIEFSYPPLPTQKKIAAILSAYDDLIENNTRRIKILEEMARSLYHEWFVKFRFPGHEQVKMVESELGLIPEGWEVKPIGEVIDTTGGGTPSTKNPEYWKDGDIIWFSPSDLTAVNTMFITDSSKKITNLGVQKSSAKVFPAYSVMMTSRATIGVVSINTKAACTNQGFITCIPNSKLSAYHVYYWIIQNREKIINLASGATFKEINKTTFRQLEIAIPEQIIEEKFSQILNPFVKKIENLQNKNLNLRQTRDLLLPKLISGEIDVEKLEIDTGNIAA